MTVHDIQPAPRLCRTPPRGDLGGLIAMVEGTEKAFPLAQVRVRTEIVGTVARSIVEQTFENPYPHAIEAIHIFPLPSDGAITGVELRIGDRIIRADCQERSRAEATYEQAKRAGQRAALLTAERSDVHTLRVHGIEPGARIDVRLVVTEHLENVDGQLQWRFPTTIAPRYLPGTATSHEGPGTLPATDHVPDGDRLQPPSRLDGGTPLDLEVRIHGAVRSVSCAQHAVRMDLGDAVRVAPKSATLDRDVVIAFEPRSEDEPVVRAWTDGSHTLVHVTPPRLQAATVPRDAVFAIDVSGSMQGSKMEAARLALKTAVHGLNPGDRFRLIAFDNRTQPMSPDLLPFDDAHVERADAWIDGLVARGGTEMLSAVRECLKHDPDTERLTTVLFITDGQVWNEAELVAAVHHAEHTRFFTMGIDTAVNSALLQRMARVGGGTCELATPSDDIEGIVANLEARFGSPVLTEVGVEGLPAAHLQKGTVFAGRSETLLVEGSPEVVTVAATSPTGPTRWNATVETSPMPLGVLWARQRIAALEDRLVWRPYEEEALRPDLIAISTRHQVLSRFTAFVAVDSESDIARPVRTVVQPAERPEGWAMGGAPAAAPAPAPRAAPTRRRARAITFSAPADIDEDAPAVLAEGFSDSRSSGFLGIQREPARKGASDPWAALVHSQQTNGSFGTVESTLAALLALVFAGHTRRSGSRRRAVTKAANLLSAHTDERWVAEVLALLDRADAGDPIAFDPTWSALYAAGPAGILLQRVVTGA